MTRWAQNAISWTEQGFVPDSAIRAGMRRLMARRLDEIKANDAEAVATGLTSFIDTMRVSPVALVPELANEQHYEVPPAFFEECLGAQRKYSCCYWPESVNSLDQAEEAALCITARRAGIENGMTILDLGCGWGSASLWMAANFPDCRITGVSNSTPQREFIEAQAELQGLKNLTVLTRDMNDFEAPQTYDRIVSVEMFEHMRNWQQLFERVSHWLNDDGRFFMHIFCHRSSAYPFEDNGPGDWMSRHFFSGGIMPSFDLPLHFQKNLALEKRWAWDGRHYERTSNAWLANMDERRDSILHMFRETYGDKDADRWFMRWRMFYMACAELFGYNHGQEWLVGHYLFAPRGAS